MFRLPDPASKRIAVVLVCATFAASVALLAIAGWIFDIEALKRVFPGWPAMRPVTATGFVLISIGLSLAVLFPRDKRATVPAMLIGGLICAAPIAMLAAYFFTAPAIADQFLLPDIDRSKVTAENRMSPHSVVIFVFVGASLALLHGRRWAARISALAALAALSAGFASVLGHLYQAKQLYGFSNANGMAVHTAVLHVAVAMGLIAANERFRLGRLFFSDGTGGWTIRRLIPVVILVPTAIGWLRMFGQERGLFDGGFGTAMGTFLIVALISAIVIYLGRSIHRADRSQKAVEAELKVKENRYRELFDYSQGLICIHDCEGVLTTVNPAALALTEYSLDEIVGKNIADLLPPEHRPGMAAFYREIVNEGISNGLMPIMTKTGRRMMWRYHSILVTEEGKEPYVIGHGQDVTELMAAQSQLKKLSLTDELTGLLNRRGFLHLAEQQFRLERHQGTARGLNLLFADMDGLKKINDTIGHEAGSDAIKALASAVKSVVRSGDLVARWGGDEFVILTIGAEDENVDLMIERIERRLSEHNAESGKPYKVACSIGKAPVNLDGRRTFEEIIAEADEAMYAAKRRRKAARTEAPPVIPEPQPMHDDLAWY